MSKLTVGTIDTPDGTTPLLMETGSGASGGQIKLESANDNILFDGTPVFTGTLPPDTTARVTANAAFDAANAAFDAANTAKTLPQNRQTTAYVLTATDSGKHIRLTGGNITVPNGVFSNGDVVVIWNAAQPARNINNGTGVTLYQPAANATGNITLGGYGLATVMCVDDISGGFTVSGAGIE